MLNVKENLITEVNVFHDFEIVLLKTQSKIYLR